MAWREPGGAIVQSTYPCCTHSSAKLTPRDVAKLNARLTEQVVRRCNFCNTHYLVYVVGAVSQPDALEWFIFG